MANPITVWEQDSDRAEDVTGTQVGTKVAIDSNQVTLLAGEDQKNDVLVTEQGRFKVINCPAGQATTLEETTGVAGDRIESLLAVVLTPATSQVQIKDGADTAIEVLPNNVAGGVGTYPLPVKGESKNGAWQVICGAGVHVVASCRVS